MSEVNWLNEFGARLEDLLNYTGVTRAELADILETSQASVSRYINGVQMPSVDTIISIAIALDANIDDLVNFGEPVH